MLQAQLMPSSPLQLADPSLVRPLLIGLHRGKVQLMPVQMLIVAHKYDAVQSQGPSANRHTT